MNTSVPAAPKELSPAEKQVASANAMRDSLIEFFKGNELDSKQQDVLFGYIDKVFKPNKPLPPEEVKAKMQEIFAKVLPEAKLKGEADLPEKQAGNIVTKLMPLAATRETLSKRVDALLTTMGTQIPGLDGQDGTVGVRQGRKFKVMADLEKSIGETLEKNAASDETTKRTALTTLIKKTLTQYTDGKLEGEVDKATTDMVNNIIATDTKMRGMLDGTFTELEIGVGTRFIKAQEEARAKVDADEAASIASMVKDKITTTDLKKKDAAVTAIQGEILKTLKTPLAAGKTMGAALNTAIAKALADNGATVVAPDTDASMAALALAVDNTAAANKKAAVKDVVDNAKKHRETVISETTGKLWSDVIMRSDVDDREKVKIAQSLLIDSIKPKDGDVSPVKREQAKVAAKNMKDHIDHFGLDAPPSFRDAATEKETTFAGVPVNKFTMIGAGGGAVLGLGYLATQENVGIWEWVKAALLTAAGLGAGMAANAYFNQKPDGKSDAKEPAKGDPKDIPMLAAAKPGAGAAPAKGA